MSWKVKIRGKAEKGAKKLPQNMRAALDVLRAELEADGPFRRNWTNYGKLKNQGKGVEKHHCHLNSNKPRWVVCWEILSKEPGNQVLEIYYVGSHQNAPY